MAKNENKLSPMRITAEDGNVYVLEFDRDSVRFAENRGFDVSELTKYPNTNIPALFYYAFRKNHKSVSRGQTDAILEEMQGLTAAEIERLVQLYNQPVESLLILDDGGRKNSKVTVEL